LSHVDSDIEKELVPYVYATEWNLECLDLDIGFERNIEILDFADPEHETFAQLWLKSNQLAFGGLKDMGMPNWVFVDCAIMSFAAIGFMLPAGEVPQKIHDEIDIPDDYDGWVPVSEYSVCPSVEERTVAGFSLHSRIEGLGIGTRTKAFGLHAADVEYQTGVTQYRSNALKVHTRFGPMELLVHQPAVHEHSQHSFSYRLHVPSQRDLASMARGDQKSVTEPADYETTWQFHPDSQEGWGRLAEEIRSDEQVFIVPPGFYSSDEGHSLPIAVT
jgi:hypothetical protein